MPTNKSEKRPTNIPTEEPKNGQENLDGPAKQEVHEPRIIYGETRRNLEPYDWEGNRKIYIEKMLKEKEERDRKIEEKWKKEKNFRNYLEEKSSEKSTGKIFRKILRKYLEEKS